MGLAQIAMLLDAQRRPGADLSLRDYLIRPMELRPEPSQAPADSAPAEVTEAEAAAIAEALGFNPRKKKSTPQPTETTAPP